MIASGAPCCEQRADLHRRGVRAQQPPVGEVEGVVHRPRRMIGGNVERLEVVEVVLDLRARGDIEAGTAEQRLDPQTRPGDRVQAAALLAAPRAASRRCARRRARARCRRARARARAPRAPPALLLRLVDARAGGRALARPASCPSAFSCSVSAPFLPSQRTRTSSSAARSPHAATSASAWPVRAVRSAKTRPLRQLIPRAVFACCAIAPKAAVSCTAMSASTLRSISTPALFRPLMMRL